MGLETENKNLKRELNRMSKLVNYGYKLKKRREEIVKKLSEKNRILEEELHQFTLNDKNSKGINGGTSKKKSNPNTPKYTRNDKYQISQ